MNERIKELRKALKLTQEAFAERISVKRNTVATYEMGKSTPSDSAVSLICREFHVNEEWLRTGEGEMFRQQSRDEAIRAFFDDVLTDEPDSFRLHFVSALSKMTPSQWEVIADLAERLAAENEEDSGVSEPSVEELEEEYKKIASSFVSSGDSSASTSTGGAGVA